MPRIYDEQNKRWKDVSEWDHYVEHGHWFGSPQERHAVEYGAVAMIGDRVVHRDAPKRYGEVIGYTVKGRAVQWEDGSISEVDVNDCLICGRSK